MRTLVFGGTGMLGRAVAERWRREGWAVLALGHGQADVCDPIVVEAWAARFQPSVIVNCAAFTRVDDCETREAHATHINGESVANLVAAAQRRQALLVHISSDYVFDGRATAPIPEDAQTAPRSAYGRGKLRGEQLALGYDRALVVRTSWLFGPGGPNFAATIRRLLLEGQLLRVVDDQVGRPTYTPFLARALRDLVAAGTTGLVHYGNRDAVSWHAFASAIAAAVAPAATVLPVPTSEFPRPAERPAYSVLDVSRFEAATGRIVEPWTCGLIPYLELLGESRS
jgi:dTDP-4-dehydrorhamnose reductase